jgi:hypothetical protein
MTKIGNNIDRKLFLSIAGFFFFFYLLTARGYLSTYDYYNRFLLTRNIVEKGSFRLPPDELAVQGVDGGYYAKYSPGESILFIPFYAAGKLASRLVPEYPGEMVEQFFCSLLFQIATALSCGILYLLGRRTGLVRKTALAMTLLYGAASLAWPYSKFHSVQPLETLFILLAAYAVIRYGSERSPRLLLLSGVWAAIAAVCRITALIFVLPVFAAIAVFVWFDVRSAGKNRVKSSLATILTHCSLFVLPLLPVLIAFVVYNIIRFGSPADFGYGRFGQFLVPSGREFEGNMLAGFAGFLISPGRGLLCFVPVLFLVLPGVAAMWRRCRTVTILAFTTVVVYLLFYSRFTAWYGTEAWGPRYIVPTIPFLFLPVGHFLEGGIRSKGKWVQGLTVILVVLSFLNQIPPVTVSPGRYFNRIHELERRHVWVDPVLDVKRSPLVMHWKNLAEVLSIMGKGQVHQPSFDEEVIDIREGDPYDYRIHSLATNVLNFWYVYLYYLGFPLFLLLIAVVAVSACAILFALSLRRLLRAPL